MANQNRLCSLGVLLISYLVMMNTSSIECSFISPYAGYGYNPIASPFYGYGLANAFGFGFGKNYMGYGHYGKPWYGGYGIGYPFGGGYGHGYGMGMGYGMGLPGFGLGMGHGGLGYGLGYGAGYGASYGMGYGGFKKDYEVDGYGMEGDYHKRMGQDEANLAKAKSKSYTSGTIGTGFQ